MRILYQNHAVVHFNEGLVSSLREMGHEVKTFQHRPMIDSLCKLTTPSILPLTNSIRELKRFGGVTKQYEVLHLNDPIDGELGVVAKINRRPLVVTLHGSPAEHYDLAGGGVKGILTHRVRYDYLGLLHDLGGRIATNTQYTAKSLWNYSRISAKVIYNGVRIDMFTPAKPRGYLQEALGIPYARKVVLWVGRGYHNKDPFTFLTSAERVAREHPDVAFVMGLWYRGPLDDQIAAFVHSSEPLRRSLFVVSQMPWTLMPEIYASSDLLVHTSPNEGFGNAVSEAMSSGKPVIVADKGGPSEYVGEGGLLFRSGDREDLCAKMERLLSDDERRRGMGASARKIACTNLSWHKAAVEYSRLYRN
jgi:glycosyltransferase involved in cell wall biosynthesis